MVITMKRFKLLFDLDVHTCLRVRLQCITEVKRKTMFLYFSGPNG